ncbi:AaceriACR073Cp [[Ashbya] aceris (nom. inval.)]|nr:AaceriACR073Cp [[Ashbya] aceris (nom. inval.)]
MAAHQYRYSDHSMSSTLKLPDDDYDELEDEYKRQNRQLALSFTRIGLVVVALVWGTFLLLNSIPVLEESGRAQPTTSHLFARNGKAKVNFESIRNQTFTPRFQQLKWTRGLSSVHDDKGLFVKKDDDVYSLKSVFDESYTRELFRGNTFEHEGVGYVVDAFEAAPDLSHGLVRTNTTQNWRHSTFAAYFVYSIEKREFHLVGQNLAVAEWSPDSQRIAYVKENDLYLYSVADGNVSRVTSDGSATIFNGRSDWVYEEEVLSSGVALWWSPTGKYVAYFKINEEQVHEFPIAYYLQEEDALYPEVRKIKYPKSGTPNPIVTLNIFDVTAEKNSVVNFGDTATLITEVAWVGETQVLAKYMDRSAQVLTVALVNTDENKPFTTPRVESANGGWWEVGRTVMYIPRNDTNDRANDGYVDVIPVNGYNHLAYFSPPSASTPTILTSGNWEVVDGPVAFDLDTNDVFFIATKKSSMERHLYYVNLFQPNDIQEVTDTSKEGVYDVSFSEGSRFLVLTYRGPGVPYQKLVDLKSLGTDNDSNGNVFGETLYYLEENKALRETLKNYSFNYPKFQELNLGDDAHGEKVVANSLEILPPDFDPDLRNHYPVFFFAYGGPGSQQVRKEFSIAFLQVVAAQLDAIVVVVDGRGTGFKGKQFREVVSGDLGHYEAEDQIAAAKLYSEKYYVNKERISLFGWSYGGYLTLKTLERDAGRYFKYGISVAPVTDWRLYDSVYTERYMSEPLSNARGYADAKVHNVSALASVPRFLLMHGTGDDNVHFQQSLVLLDKLNLAGVENYDLLVFPDSTHSIMFHNANVIIYNKILNWARQAFNGDFVDQK